MPTSSTSAFEADGSVQQWTIGRLIVAHRGITLATVAVCTVVVAMFLFAVLGPKASAVNDATTCSEWGSVNWNQQTAYARRYVHEHGGIAGQTSPLAVINAIDNGCMVAFGEDVDDTTSVVKAISGNF